MIKVKRSKRRIPGCFRTLKGAQMFAPIRSSIFGNPVKNLKTLSSLGERDRYDIEVFALLEDIDPQAQKRENNPSLPLPMLGEYFRISVFRSCLRAATGGNRASSGKSVIPG
jgi:hypothetical protein